METQIKSHLCTRHWQQIRLFLKKKVIDFIYVSGDRNETSCAGFIKNIVII